MLNIPLQALPNQSFSISLDSGFYDIDIAQCNDMMYITIIRNEIVIVSNCRMVSGEPVIPYEYLTDGNFVLMTLNDELPFYDQFGISQSLIYASPTEIALLSVGA